MVVALKTWSPAPEGYRGHTFTLAVRNKVVRRDPEFLKISVATLLCRLEIISGTAATELRNLNAMGP